MGILNQWQVSCRIDSCLAIEGETNSKKNEDVLIKALSVSPGELLSIYILGLLEIYALIASPKINLHQSTLVFISCNVIYIIGL